MISLKTLFLDAYPEQSLPDAMPEILVKTLSCDSRQIEPGSLFIAVNGAKQNGAVFAGEAVRQGACAVVSEEKIEGLSVPCLLVPNSRQAASRLANSFFGHPTQSLRIVGVTGTNGKTTVTYLLEHIFRFAGISAGVLGTVSYRYAGREFPAKETTPGPLRLQELFSGMKKSGCSHVFMEVSSHALDQNRVDGISFVGAVFTNLTQDHLDYHISMQAYFEAKLKLFQSLNKEGFAVLNADDAWTMQVIPHTKARVVTYGLGAQADYRAENIIRSGEAMTFDLVYSGGKTRVSVPMFGKHNAYNVLAAMAAAAAEGISPKASAEALSRFEGVPGRLEPVRKGQNFTVLIDFAHTPDGLLNVLNAVREEKPKRLLLVFGCGGDRDRKKRPVMAEIASRLADRVFVTSDNPRSEDPREIAREVVSGFPESFRAYRVVLDRHQAIREALMAATESDVVLIAGKGHERSQIIGDQSYYFSDREEAEKVLVGR